MLNNVGLPGLIFILLFVAFWVLFIRFLWNVGKKKKD